MAMRDSQLSFRKSVPLVERPSWCSRDRKKSALLFWAEQLGHSLPGLSYHPGIALADNHLFQGTRAFLPNSLQKRPGLIPEWFYLCTSVARALACTKVLSHREISESSRGPESRPPKVCPSRRPLRHPRSPSGATQRVSSWAKWKCSHFLIRATGCCWDQQVMASISEREAFHWYTTGAQWTGQWATTWADGQCHLFYLFVYFWDWI